MWNLFGWVIAYRTTSGEVYVGWCGATYVEVLSYYKGEAMARLTIVAPHSPISYSELLRTCEIRLLRGVSSMLSKDERTAEVAKAWRELHSRAHMNSFGDREWHPGFWSMHGKCWVARRSI